MRAIAGMWAPHFTQYFCYRWQVLQGPGSMMALTRWMAAQVVADCEVRDFEERQFIAFPIDPCGFRRN